MNLKFPDKIKVKVFSFCSAVYGIYEKCKFFIKNKVDSNPVTPYIRKYKKIAKEKWNRFNFLNDTTRLIAKVCYYFKWQKGGDFFKNLMVLENGTNRFVMIRYIFKELFLYFAVAFLFFFMIFFCNQILLIAEDVLKKRVPLWDVIVLITYALPMIIAQSAPYATLVGFLMCLGRLASDNEVLIIRASGLGYRVILIPVITLGILISLGSFFVNDYLLPLGTIKYNDLKKSIIASNPAVELQSNSVKRTNDKTLVIGEVDKTSVSDILFFDQDEEGNERIIIAEQSDVKKSKESGVIMTMEMANPTVIIFKKANSKNYDILHADKLDLNVFESSVFERSEIRPNEMTSYDLYKKIQNFREINNDPSSPQLNRYITEFNKKFSLPFGSFFFAILSLPLAFIFGRHNGQTIGLIIGIFIAVFYWGAMILGQIFSNRSGVNGFFTMWAPNTAVGIAAVVFYFRLVKR